jgi:anaerobic magnesium-protoporphyrin IX monomethyl ester cyclase
MRILLTLPLDPSYRRESPDLGLGYLAAVLQQEGHSVDLLLRAKVLRRPEVFQEYVRRGGYDLIGIKTFSCQAKAIRATTALIRRVAPHACIVLGGAHVSADPEHTFVVFPDADFGLQREAEIGLSQLAAALRDGRLPECAPDIAGLIWRDGERTVVNPPRLVEHLDELPFPAWELMKPADFPNLPFNGYSRRHPIAPMILTRGCPFHCTFCGAGKINGHRVRSRSPENVMAEIRLLTQRYGVREIHFYDSNCAYRGGPLRAVLQQIIKEKIDLTWCAPNGIRLDSVDPDLARLMKASGCFQVNVGIESGSPRILRQIQKHLSLDLVHRSVRILRDAGLEVVGFFMLGFPGETREDIRQTISLALDLPLTGASFNIYSPLPGTSDYQRLFVDGQPDLEALESLDFVSYQNNLSELSPAELRFWQRRAYLRFHLRPRVLRSFLRNLNRLEKILLIGNQAWEKLLD